MSDRTLVVILFFWAVLAIVTPTLVRWSASAKPHVEFKANGEKRTEIYTGRVLEMLSRRALVPKLEPKGALAPEPTPSPSPSPAPAPASPVSLLNSKEINVYLKDD